MPDDLKRRGPEDPQRIDMNQLHEVRYWTRRFEISEQILRSAVRQAGDRVSAVENWLRNNRRP